MKTLGTCERVTISDVYGSNPSLFGLMVAMGAPWDEDTAKVMDQNYFGMFSGIKTSTEFLRSCVVDGELDRELVANCLYSHYAVPWKRIWDGYNVEYSPIDSYLLDESISKEIDDSKTTTSTVNYTGEETKTVEGTENTVTSGTDEQSGTTTEKTDSTTSDSRTRELDGTTTGTGKVVFEGTESVNGTESLQHGESISRNNALTNYNYGFNSPDKVPTTAEEGDSTDTHSGTDNTTTTSTKTTNSEENTTTGGTSKENETNSGTVTVDNTKTITASSTGESSGKTDVSKEGTEKIVDGHDTTGSEEGTYKSTVTITSNKKGNLGTHTVQELLREQFELWKWSFFNQVFEDCDKFLAVSVISYL